MSKSAPRKCKSTIDGKYKECTESIFEIDDFEKDPFHSSDNDDKDKDYDDNLERAKKKRRIAIEVTTDSNGKQLNPKQRLERLKAKFGLTNAHTAQKAGSLLHQKRNSSMLVTKNTKSIHSIGVETISSGSNCQKVLEENQSFVDFVNHDDLFTDKDEAVGGDLRAFDTETGMGEHEHTDSDTHASRDIAYATSTDIDTHALIDATSTLSTSPVKIYYQERAENVVTEDRKMSLILEMLEQISEMNNNLMQRLK